VKIGIGKAKITAWRQRKKMAAYHQWQWRHRKLASKREIMKENSWYESNQ
jgi:hypothetical protein